MRDPGGDDGIGVIAEERCQLAQFPIEEGRGLAVGKELWAGDGSSRGGRGREKAEREDREPR